MAISKIILNGVTQMDVTDTTATADKILASYGAYGADGLWMNGTASGGGSSYTFLGSGEFTVSTTSTTEISAGTLNVPISSCSPFAFIMIRDKAGQRTDHWYGCDCWIMKSTRTLYSYRDSGGTMQRSTNAYGVYPDSGMGGSIPLLARYNATWSKTIDGTFSVSVYNLDYPE